MIGLSVHVRVLGAATAPWICGLVLVSFSVTGTAYAGTSMIGRTWPIAEPDALAEIEARTARQPANMAPRFGPRSRWSALHGATLGRTTQDRTRSVIPFYRLDEDIRLPSGKLLYPAGFTFNPLSYVTLHERLVIVAPRDLDWALAHAAPNDFILLSAGGAKDADALTLGERVKHPLFILEERVKARLGLTVAPVIVRQIGQKLELAEIRVERSAMTGVRP